MAQWLFPPQAQPFFAQAPLFPPNGGAVAQDTILLGKYQISRPLGSGTFGVVYAARSILSGEAVAIKRIQNSWQPNDVQRIVGEIEAMRRLQHRNICRLVDLFYDHSYIYLVMELAGGGDLQKRLDRSGGRLSERDTLHYFRQLVSALYYCHQRGVAHRDVKPQNILLDERDNVKLSDFGVSFVAAGDAASLRQTCCGTHPFMAPEVQLCGWNGGYDGPKADAWSCGVVLLVLLLGNQAFVGRKPNLLGLIPAFVSIPTQRIISQLLNPDPVSRMSIKTLMEAGWLNY